MAGEALSVLILRRLADIDAALDAQNKLLATLATKDTILTTEAQLEAYINGTVVPAWQAIAALGGQFNSAFTALQSEVASLQQQLAAATGQPVDETPALNDLQNLVAQMTQATSQGAAELTQAVAPIAAAKAASATVPGAPAPSSPAAVTVSGAVPATASILPATPALEPVIPESELGPSDTPPSPANK